MSAMQDGTATTRLNRDTDERFLPLRRQLEVTSFGMNQIALQPTPPDLDPSELRRS
jgi:hypothetical protein